MSEFFPIDRGHTPNDIDIVVLQLFKGTGLRHRFVDVDESIAVICSLLLNKLPSNMNLEVLDEECASLDYVTEVRNQEVSTVLKNNFAFGGINTSLILKKYI